jgi:hypothetical protein
MSSFTLPDSSDLRDTIADCVDSLGIAPESERARIIENCLAPVTLLFGAGEMACAAGPQERAVFAYFLSLMEAQARGFDLAQIPPPLEPTIKIAGWKSAAHSTE